MRKWWHASLASLFLTMLQSEPSRADVGFSFGIPSQVDHRGTKLPRENAIQLFESICLAHDPRGTRTGVTARKNGFKQFSGEGYFNPSLNAEVIHHRRKVKKGYFGVCMVTFVKTGHSDTSYRKQLGNVPLLTQKKNGEYCLDKNCIADVDYGKSSHNKKPNVRSYWIISAVNIPAY